MQVRSLSRPVRSISKINLLTTSDNAASNLGVRRSTQQLIRNLTRGQRLFACRKRIKWGQTDVANQLGLSQALICRAEADDGTIKDVIWATIKDFCDMVDIRAFREEDKPTSNPEGNQN